MNVKGFDTDARWFAGKDRPIESVAVAEAIPLPTGRLELADVTYADGGGERYLLLPDDVDWAALLECLAVGPIDGPRRASRAAW